MGGPMGGQFLTEEEKKNQPKVTPELLKRVFSTSVLRPSAVNLKAGRSPLTTTSVSRMFFRTATTRKA